MAFYWNLLRQSAFIASPTITEKTIGDLTGKVAIVTGGNAGVGWCVCKILYGANATVYLFGRNEQKCIDAIKRIKAAHPSSRGSISHIKYDSSDLSSVKATAQAFLDKESELHYLCNNAGVMFPPVGMKGAQGHDLQQVTNCLGPWLLTTLLAPVLKSTAAKSPPNSVRVSWAGSSGIDILAPKDGIDIDSQTGGPRVFGKPTDYGQSKLGNLFLANAFADDTAGSGIVSVCFNPGNLRTELQRHMNPIARTILFLFIYEPVYGAYTELWCGFSPELTVADNGIYVAPWGQKGHNRADLTRQIKDRGVVYTKYVDWVKAETKKWE